MKRKLAHQFGATGAVATGDSLYIPSLEDPKTCGAIVECNKPTAFFISYVADGQTYSFVTCLECELSYWTSETEKEEVRLAFKKVLEVYPELGLEI